MMHPKAKRLIYRTRNYEDELSQSTQHIISRAFHA
jgi:hypothetical protein